ncbi:hypothetical protein ACJJIF_21195 [Microbulbifer sp. SSSA002]|uniref:hypothetical protein n=1 Tax=unclassified Microbulbifer TaxID=2619833 RepID=UPI004039344B
MNELFDQSQRERLHPDRCIVAGIYGAGGPSAGDNPTLRSAIQLLHGRLFYSFQKTAISHYLIDGVERGKAAILFGYSRGGSIAIKIANTLGRANIPIQQLVTFDAYSLIDSRIFNLEYDNIRRAYNFFQRNPRTAGRYGWWGTNPYWGTAVHSAFINVQQFDFTGTDYEKGMEVSHLNIVRMGLKSLQTIER